MAVLHASPRRQPLAQGITSSTAARLTDAEGCTSHPAAGEAQGLSLVIKKTRFLLKMLIYSKRQHAAVLLPGEDRKLLLSCLSFIIKLFLPEKVKSRCRGTQAPGCSRQQEADSRDFPCAETAQEGWVSWRFYLKNSTDSVPPQQAVFMTPEQSPPMSPPPCQQAPLTAGAHKIPG